jgi:hypothetical protein
LVLVPEDPEFPEIGGFSPIEPIASAIIAQVVIPETVEEGIPPDFGCKGKRIGSGLKEGAEKLGGISKALPITSAAGSRVLRRAELWIPELSIVFVPPVPAGIGVPVPGIDEKKVLSAEAGVWAFLAGLVAAVQGVKRTSGGEHPDPRPEFRHCVYEGFKDGRFLISGKGDQGVLGGRPIYRLKTRGCFVGVDTHGVAHVDDGEAEINDKTIKPSESLNEFPAKPPVSGMKIRLFRCVVPGFPPMFRLMPRLADG